MENTFAQECRQTLQQKRKEGIDIYAPCITKYMKQCQEEWQSTHKETSYDEKLFESKWSPLLEAAKGFDPRNRCWTESEFIHFPILLIMKQKKQTDDYDYYMLRYRIDEAKGTEKDKTFLIQQVQRGKHERDTEKSKKK